MKSHLGYEEQYLLDFLRRALHSEPDGGAEPHMQEQGSKSVKARQKEPDWNRLVRLAKSHAVLPLLYDVCAADKTMPKEERETLTRISQQTVRQSYHLLFLTRDILGLLFEHGIRAVPLKGAVTASFYPVPELRKSGDIDLLFETEESARMALKLLMEHGFSRKEVQTANHHLVCASPEGIEAELHVMLSEPFDHERINQYLRSILPGFFRHTAEKEVLGIPLPVLEAPYHAFYLLVHMLQHFLRAGFGLKLLCDWTVLLRSGMTAEEECHLKTLCGEAGMTGFAVIVTAVCVRSLGLPDTRAAFLLKGAEVQETMLEEFLAEVFEAEEFGRSSSDRMVVLRGTRLADYLREFHHQMALRYPEQAKHRALWPALWAFTLGGFLYRNRKVRRVSVAAVLRKAGKRSRMMAQIGLFKDGSGNKTNKKSAIINKNRNTGI